jgi:hypothetical protein
VPIRSNSKKLWINVICVSVASILLFSQANAQVAGASLSGTVTDQSGAIIPQARVSIKNVATDIETSAIASQQFLNFSLQVGQVAEKVEVAGNLSRVLPESSSIKNLVTAKTVVELPLNGCDWNPIDGSSAGRHCGHNSGTSERKGDQVASGKPVQSQEYQMDGRSTRRKDATHLRLSLMTERRLNGK